MKRKLFISILLVALAICSGLPGVCYAQAPEPSSKPNLHFDRITAADGLSFSTALSILQDGQGFMWFGTRYGLNKYDGYNFTVYDLTVNAPDPWFGNAIRFLYEDRSGDLWIGTYADLVRRDIETGTFVHYTYGAATPESPGEWAVSAIGEDATGNLWVGTGNGLYRYEPSTDTFTNYLRKQTVSQIYHDHQGGLWIGTRLWEEPGSSLWHSKPGSQGREEPEFIPYPFGDEYVTVIQEDQQGNLWVGTAGDGIKRLNLSTGEITRFQYDPEDSNSLSHNNVTSILVDAANLLWIGTDDGLNLFDPATGGFYHYYNDPGDPHSLSSNQVLDLYQDRSGVLWIATLAGINKLNENASRFIHYPQRSNPPGRVAGAQAAGAFDPPDVLDPNNLPSLSDSRVGEVYEDSHGFLWIGTFSGGLNRLDRRSGKTTVFRHDPADPTSLSGDEVSVIYEDKAGTLWIGSNGGLDRFDPQTGTFEHLAVLRSHLVDTITEDHQGNLWVGYWGGILRSEPGASSYSFTSPTPIGDMVQLTRVNQIYPDRAGAIWISTQEAGLFRIDPAQDAGLFQMEPAMRDGSEPMVVHFSQDVGDPENPGPGSVMSFYEDAQGTLWMGTVQNGLVRYNRGSNTFTQYIPAIDIVQYVSCIQGDAQGFLWMGTKLGLARFDPRSETFSYFDARDGLVAGETLTCHQNKQGEMFFGGFEGLSTFFPDQIRDNPIPPPVVITGVNLKNQALRTDLAADEQIELPYQDNYLSFDFAALDYTAPAKNQYAYKMEGLDADWIKASNRRHADYPDLKPGTYTFRVKASNNSGVWNEQGAAVHITITPPFWQTGWFLGLLGLALAAVVAGGVRLRLSGVEARSRNLERLVNERTGALEQKTLELRQRNLEVERRRQELEALYQADEELLLHFRLEEILQTLVDIAVDILHADKGSLLVWDENKEYLVVRAYHGFNPSTAANLKIRLGEGIAGKVAISGKPFIVEDTFSNPDVSHQITDPEGIRSFMQVPIRIKGETFGVFSADYLHPKRFDENEQRLLIAFAQRTALAIQNAQAYQQEQELAVLEERSRLARELHDAVTQTLFSASLVAEALPAVWEKDSQEGRGLLQELRGLSRGALAEMRTLLLELRPAALLESSLAELLRQLGEAASGREGIPVSVQVEGQADLPPDVQIAFYRITQEALNNVVKHARAHQATVRLCYRTGDQPVTLPSSEGELARLSVLLSISDDGRGFDPAQIPHNRLGLGIMQERAQAIGAILTIESQPGQGARVTVLWKQESKQEAI